MAWDPDKLIDDLCPDCGANIVLRVRDVLNRTQRVNCDCGCTFTLSYRFRRQVHRLRRKRPRR